MKIASELNMSSGKIVDIVDEYRKRVAPLAKKWDEWRKENGGVVESNEPDDHDEPTADEEQNEEREDGAA